MILVPGLGARYYDPTLGRFTQTDPSGQEINQYAYSGCNPINNLDFTGLNCTGAILFSVVTGFTTIASFVGVIVGAPTVALSIFFTLAAIGSAGTFVYSIGDVLNQCT